DEYIGLPSGFLFAGASSVVSSLWNVNDLATALLMIKFYQFRETYSNVTLALNHAQIWLRDATTEIVLQSIQELNLRPSSIDPIRDWLNRYDLQAKPFSDPYFWAAFYATGE
ncbi:MAG: CHAT domain-containing protein, partial [Spirulina sp.]